MLPAGVLKALKLHQLLGVCFLFGALQQDGALLCDDPGLGKTFTSIALISAFVESRRCHRVLVSVRTWRVGGAGGVCPLDGHDDAARGSWGASETGLHARLKLRALGPVKAPEQMVVVASMSMVLNHGAVSETSLNHPYMVPSRQPACLSVWLPVFAWLPVSKNYCLYACLSDACQSVCLPVCSSR